MGRPHEVILHLRRDSPAEHWGFSLVGGADVNAPLIVTRVGFGSPANGVLQRGDIITKVGNYDARDIRHQDAQALFQNAGTNIRVVVQRENSGGRHNTSTASSRTSSRNYSPLSVSPHLSPKGGNFSTSSMASPGGAALTPYYTTPFTPLDDYHFSVHEVGGGRRPKSEEGNQDIHVNNQPYRTTPLVLPGAKVKREPGPTESYLRHHPNPSVRAPPHHLDNDLLLRQKVTNTVLHRIGIDDAKIVNKQFNSPIHLYSDANVAETVAKQTGAAPKKSVKFNPAESETYKALQEEAIGDHVQEVTVPPQTKVFTPHKNIPPKPPAPKQQHSAHNYNSMGEATETIHQSNSFKRLMWSVMAETNY